MTEEIKTEISIDCSYYKDVVKNEILIDGVDVAGCEHYTTMEDCDGVHDLYEQLDDYCSTKKNCYYKQLKRLEQENKELKEMYRLSCLKCEYKNTKADVDKYRFALEEIKKVVTNPYPGKPRDVLNIINEVLE